MLSKSRNFPEGDPIFDSVPPRVGYIGGFKSDKERDSAMTEVSNFDIAFVKNNRWNSGTAQNIKRRHGM